MSLNEQASESGSTVISRWDKASSGTAAPRRADASTSQQRKMLTPNTFHFRGPSTASAAGSGAPRERVSAQGISQRRWPMRGGEDGGAGRAAAGDGGLRGLPAGRGLGAWPDHAAHRCALGHHFQTL